MTARIPLDGVKVSEELTLIHPSTDALPEGGEAETLNLLSRSHIALFYLTMWRSESRSHLCFCLRPDLAAPAEQLISSTGVWTCRRTAGIGLLAVYPHRHRWDVLTRSLRGFADAGIPVCGVGSTLAALTFVLPFSRLDQAAACLQDVFEIPDHSPVQTDPAAMQIQYRETAAVYFEPRAKSYGINSEAGLILVQPTLPARALRPNTPASDAASSGNRFVFVSMEAQSGRAPILHVVARPGEIEGILSALGPAVGPGVSARAVDALSFQGPHFCERYGIAAAAISTLRDKGLDLIAAGFTGNMAYLILPAGSAETATAVLKECFNTP